MKTYKVIHIISPHKSFSWNDGLFAIISKEKNILNLCKISDKGEPQLYDNGKPMITCTGAGNTGVKQTKLKITF